MTDAKADHEPTLVERWLQEQKEWQRTLLAYVDSMTGDDEFLVNLGNAMRGSLLAGKAYPTAGVASPPDADERLDKVLFALNTLQGQVQDLVMSVEELRRIVTPATAVVPKAVVPKAVVPKKAVSKRASPRRTTPPRTRKARA